MVFNPPYQGLSIYTLKRVQSIHQVWDRPAIVQPWCQYDSCDVTSDISLGKYTFPVDLQVTRDTPFVDFVGIVSKGPGRLSLWLDI